MQPSTTGQGFEFRVKPQKQFIAMYTLPQGVFSETLDYNEGAKIRKEFSSLRSQRKAR